MKENLSEELKVTLEQLFKNEEALSSIEEHPDLGYEREVLQRTQVSLAAHLVHLESHPKYRLRRARKEKVRAVIARYRG